MAKSQHVDNFRVTLEQAYNSSGKEKNFSTWLSDLKESFDQDKANQYYNQITLGLEKFNSVFYYLNQVSNKFGYQMKEGLDMSDEIKDRIKFISSKTNITDLSYLDKIFKTSELNDIISSLAMNSAEAYIFDGDQLGKIPNQKKIFERIGVQTSNGRNKATLNEYLLDSLQSTEFVSAMNKVGALVLIPSRDGNGNINNFNLGIKAKSRSQIFDVLNNQLQLKGEQLPINYEDPIAVQIVNAVVQGKTLTLDGSTFNFGKMNANFGQRAEALTQAIYDNYTQTGETLDGTVLQGIITNQLTRVDKKTKNLMFNVPSNFSGLAGPDMIIEGRAEQNKNLGNSRRFTYGDIKGILAITGFYGGKNTFDNELKFGYSQMNKEVKEQVNEIHRNANVSVWNGLVSVFKEAGIDLGEDAQISVDNNNDYDEEEYVSKEDIVSTIMEFLVDN